MNITEQRILAFQYQHFCQQKQQNNPCHSLELLIKLCVYLRELPSRQKGQMIIVATVTGT